MTTNYGDPPHDGELTGGELDAILRAADDELLGYIGAAGDPNAALLAIMAAAANAGTANAPATGRDPSLAAAVIEMRSISRDIGTALDDAADAARAAAHAAAGAGFILDRATAHAHTAEGNAAGPKEFFEPHAAALSSAAQDVYQSAQKAITTAADAEAAARKAARAVADVQTSARALRDTLTQPLGSGALINTVFPFPKAATEPGAGQTLRCPSVLTNAAGKLAAQGRQLMDTAHALAQAFPSVMDAAVTLTKATRNLAAAHAAPEDKEVFATAEFITSALTKALRKAEHLERAADALAASINKARRLNPGEALAAIQVDASGADLSSAYLHDLGVLEDVIWTPETIWPQGLAAAIRARSEEIRPGVYQVRGGTERDPAKLVTV